MTDNKISMTWPQYKRRECTFKGKVIKLTNHETELLSTLLIHYPRPVTREQLVESLYCFNDDEPDFSYNCISQFLTRLRKKLGKNTVANRIRIGFYLNYDE